LKGLRKTWGRTKKQSNKKDERDVGAKGEEKGTLLGDSWKNLRGKLPD